MTFNWYTAQLIDFGSIKDLDHAAIAPGIYYPPATNTILSASENESAIYLHSFVEMASPNFSGTCVAC
jgi:hypothetical protein